MIAIISLFSVFSTVQSCLIIQNSATPPPYASCACPIDVIKNNAHGNQLLSYNNNYYSNTSKYEISEPILEGECRLTFSCQSPASYVVLIGEHRISNTGTGRKPNNYEAVCDVTTKRWDIYHAALATSIFNSPFLYLACVNFMSLRVCHPRQVHSPDASLPTSQPPTCDCPSQYITNSTEPGYKLNNFYVRGEISDDRCHWQMSCATSRMAQARVNGQLYLSTLFTGQCNKDTQKWNLSSGEGNLWTDVSIFEYACVELL